MINIDSETYFSILNRIIRSNDMSSIINEYKDDKEFLYSILADILIGNKSPNSKFIKKFILKTKIYDDYLIERATLLISYIKPGKFNYDYYEILEVNPDSTQEEIREKWIELAKEYHPDKIGDSGLEKIKRINEAYEVIGNKDKRLEYDSNYINEIPVHVSASKTILPINFVVFASTIVIFVLIAFFLKSVFFTDSEDEIKIAKIYEDSKVNKSYQTENNFDKVNQKSPEDVNIEELSDFSDISDVRKKRINQYLKKRTQTSSEKSEIQKSEIQNSESPNPSKDTESKDPKLLALDKKINELEKSGDFKVIIVNPESSISKPELPSTESPNTDLLKSQIPKYGIRNTDIPNPSSLAPNPTSSKPDLLKSENPKFEIRNSNIPNTLSLAPDTQFLTPNTYIVKSGDTLWRIARKNDTHVKDIIEVNNLKSNKLKLGQKLLIPTKTDYNKRLIAKSPSSPKSEIPKFEIRNSDIPNSSTLATNPSSLTPNPQIYTVKSGDNLWTIAKKYNMRVKNIVAANNLKNNKIKIGQKLIIPSVLDSSKQLAVKNPNLPKSEIRNPEIKTVYDFVSQYVSAYKKGDMSQIKGMFSKDAKENGVSIAKALASYNNIFKNKKIFKYDLLISTINIKNDKSYIDGDFIILFKNIDQGNTKTSNGSINWVLDWKNDSWKISELNYKLTDTVFTDESL